MLDTIVAFMESKSIWVYVFIFFAETLFTTLSTLRVVLTNRGERFMSMIISVFEILIWVIVTGTVLNSVTSDPFKIVVYGAAYSTGIFLGSVVEGRLALGIISLSIFLPEDDTVSVIINALKENGYGATIWDATGIHNVRRKVIIVVAKRKSKKDVIDLIHSFTQHAVITVSNVASIQGGYVTDGHHSRRNRSISPIPQLHV